MESSQNGRRPLPGDDDFLNYIAGAVHADHVTTAEALERERLHKLILRGRQS